MSHQAKYFLLFIGAVFILSFASGCSLQTATPADQTIKGQQTQLDNQSQADQAQPVLSISSGCIGCGKCIRFDAEHFGPNSQGPIPEVISQANLGSSNLAAAIRMCPTRAITLAN